MTKRHIEIVLVPRQKAAQAESRGKSAGTPRGKGPESSNATDFAQAGHLTEGSCGCSNCS